MPATGWLRRYWPETAWAVSTAALLAVMLVWPHWEAVPFHVVWIGLTVMYGFRVWSGAATRSSCARTPTATRS